MEPNYMRKTTLLKADPMSYNVAAALTAASRLGARGGCAPSSNLCPERG